MFFDLGFLRRKQRKEETLSLLQAGATEEETEFFFFFRKRVIRGLTATLKPIPGQGRLKARAQQSLKFKIFSSLVYHHLAIPDNPCFPTPLETENEKYFGWSCIFLYVFLGVYICSVSDYYVIIR